MDSYLIKKGLLYISAHWVFRTRILRPGSMNVTHPTIPACQSQGLSYTRLFLVRSKNTFEGKKTLFSDAMVFPKVCINSFDITANSAKLAWCVLRLLCSIYALLEYSQKCFTTNHNIEYQICIFLIYHMECTTKLQNAALSINVCLRNRKKVIQLVIFLNTVIGNR